MTSIQQWLILHIMSHTPFDIVDFLLCEVEESIAVGVKAGRQQPYAHIISYLLDRAIVQHLQNPPRHGLADSATCYKVYNPPTPSDPRRGQRALVAAQSELSPKEREAAQHEDDAIEDLDAAQGLWDEDYGSDSSDSDYTVPATPSRAHDAEARVSSSALADLAMTQTAELMKMMITMQSQFNQSMMKMQEEAAKREERTSQLFHAI